MTEIINARASKGKCSSTSEDRTKDPTYQSPKVDLPDGFVMPSKKKRRST